MFRFLPLSVLALSSLAAAQSLPTNAPECAVKCFTAKLGEADTLAPGVGASNLPGLCNTEAFVAAYNGCINDHCTGSNLAVSQALVEQVCGASTVTASAAASASSALAEASSSFASQAAEASSSLASVAASASSVVQEAANATASLGESFSSAQASITNDLGSAAASASASLQSELSNAASSASSVASAAASSASAALSSVSSAAQPTASGSTGQGSEGGGNGASPLVAGAAIGLTLLTTLSFLLLA